MPVSAALQRLLRVLDQEEELQRRELESAQGEMAKLELAKRVAGERQQKGRRLIASGVQSNDLCDRLTGMEEMLAGRHCGSVLQQRIHQSTLVIDELRTALLNKRVERKQAETLIEAAQAREAAAADRRMQQSLDDWYLTRLAGERSKRVREVSRVKR
jgi:flagellar biosynthesis chaperone FliJ